jgi:hypothetical protein
MPMRIAAVNIDIVDNLAMILNDKGQEFPITFGDFMLNQTPDYKLARQVIAVQYPDELDYEFSVEKLSAPPPSETRRTLRDVLGTMPQMLKIPASPLEGEEEAPLTLSTQQ